MIFVLHLGESIPSIVAVDKEGLKIDLSFEKEGSGPTVVIVTLKITNSTNNPFNSFIFQAAVPKVSLESLLGEIHGILQ